jgi:hypothetical protein
MSLQWFSSQEVQYHWGDVHKLLSVLVLETKHNYAGVLIRRVNSDIGKAQIERQEGAALTPVFIEDVAIASAAQPFVPDGYRIVAMLTEELRQVRVEILVHFELH